MVFRIAATDLTPYKAVDWEMQISGGLQSGDVTFSMADRTAGKTIYQGMKPLSFEFDLFSQSLTTLKEIVALINDSEGQEFWPSDDKFVIIELAEALFNKQQVANPNGNYYAHVKLTASTTFYYGATAKVLDPATYGAATEMTNEGDFDAPPYLISVVGSYPLVVTPYLEVDESDAATVQYSWGLIDGLKYMEALHIYPDQELAISDWNMRFDSLAAWGYDIVDSSGCSVASSTLTVASGGFAAIHFGGEDEINFKRSIRCIITATVTGVAAAAKLAFQTEAGGSWQVAGYITTGTQTIEVPVTGSMEANVIIWCDSAVGAVSISVTAMNCYCERHVAKSVIPILEKDVLKSVKMLELGAGHVADSFVAFRDRMWS